MREMLVACTPEQQQILYSKAYNCEVREECFQKSPRKCLQICDSNLIGAFRYLRHMQLNHKLLVRKTPQDMLLDPTLGCSKCQVS